MEEVASWNTTARLVDRCKVHDRPLGLITYNNVILLVDLNIRILKPLVKAQTFQALLITISKCFSLLSSHGSRVSTKLGVSSFAGSSSFIAFISWSSFFRNSRLILSMITCKPFASVHPITAIDGVFDTWRAIITNNWGASTAHLTWLWTRWCSLGANSVSFAFIGEGFTKFRRVSVGFLHKVINFLLVDETWLFVLNSAFSCFKQFHLCLDHSLNPASVWETLTMPCSGQRHMSRVASSFSVILEILLCRMWNIAQVSYHLCAN